MNTLYSLADAIKEIQTGKPLLIAADEALLSQLPQGNWIAGTIPYFIGPDGGESSKDKLFINDLSSYVTEWEIKSYSKDELSSVYLDAYGSGFSAIILPFGSDVHYSFALNSQKYDGFGAAPLVGWISGIHLDEMNTAKAKVYNGDTNTASDTEAIVMHCKLENEFYAELSIINIFKQSSGDSIRFLNDGFDAETVQINGKDVNFYDYLTNNKINTQFPLVADYLGAKINTSIRSLDDTNKKVYFYAPIFKDIEYKLAESNDDYIGEFMKQIPTDNNDNIAFSCNCILNYLYCDLEGKKTGNLIGPITFGEIAYMLLNQTFVYLQIKHY